MATQSSKKITRQTKPKTSTKARQLGLEKLKLSGLTAEDAKLLKMDFLSQQETNRAHVSFQSLSSLRINYFDHNKKPLSDTPKAKPFYRLRYLEQPAGFDQLTEKKALRYVQEPNTAPVAYYPLNQDWQDIVGNDDAPLIITEGEFKAAKACKEGFPTIGLGGVYNWRSNKLGIDFIETLEIVNWVKRNVYICFDSDFKTNLMVCSALRALAEELGRRGAFCHLVSLPSLPEIEKVGLDDFLVNAGPSANQMFGVLLSEAEPLGLTKPLWSFNDRYVYVRDPGMVIDQSSGFKVSPAAFKEHLEAAVNYQERQIKNDGSVSYKAVSAAAFWLKWPLRVEVNKISYRPGEEKFIDKPTSAFNIWSGWGCKPKKGNIDLFTQLIDHLFTGAEKGAKEWFLCWLAHPLQKPGIKMFSSAVLHGIKHGTGKSLIGHTMKEIYGDNFTEINQVDLHNNFNEWAEGKQFVMGDDVTGSNKRADADFLKKLITQKELRLNPKHIRTYVVPDCINYYFTANHPDSFFLEDDDRRYFIHEVFVGPLGDEFYDKYSNWLYREGGASAIFYYLMHIDISKFNPFSSAFKTSARDRAIAITQSDLGGWVRGMIANPDQYLALGEMRVNKDLFTSKEILDFYDPEQRTGTTANGMARELAKAGVRQMFNGRPVRTCDGIQARYYALRNIDHWAEQHSPKNAIEHLDGFLKKQKMRKPKKY